MVDPELIDLSKLSSDVRRRIVDYVLNVKKISPSELGYDSTYVYKIKHGKVKISDDFVKVCLKFLSHEEYAKIVGSYPPSEEVTLDTVVKVIKKAIEDVKFRELLLQLINRYLSDYIVKASKSYIVKESDIEEFIKELKAQKRSKKTIQDHVRNLRDILSRVDFVLNPDKLRDLVNELKEDSYSDYQIRDRLITLKKFIKTIVIRKDPYIGRILYDSFKVLRPKKGVVSKPLITLEEIRLVWNSLPSLESKIYMLLLVECGLRPGKEVFNIKITDIDWENRIVYVNRNDPYKKAYITFLHEKSIKWIREVYIPYRNEFVEEYINSIKRLPDVDEEDIEKWRLRLIPFDEDRLRKEIKETFRKILSKEIELYDFRRFWATYMSLKGVPGQIIDILQGRTPPKEFEVLMRHYVTIGNQYFILELRKWFDEKAPKILD